jgi:hypothetical protein
MIWYIGVMKNLLIFFLALVFKCASAQGGTEIYLFDLKVEKGTVILSNGVNITHHKGYDNQPHFHPAQPLIYYTSSDNTSRIDSSEIKIYNYHTAQTTFFTRSKDREYSPTVTPDGRAISCILQKQNGEQNLVQYPIAGGEPKVLINHLTIGYHAWASSNSLLLFVLDDSIHNSLHYYTLGVNADTVVAENIGRSLHKIPGQEAMSFIQRISDTMAIVKKMQLKNGAITNLIYTPAGKDHLTWLKGNTVLMNDSRNIFSYTEKSTGELKDRKWKPVLVKGNLSMLKGITRMAVNADNTKVAIVVNELP